MLAPVEMTTPLLASRATEEGNKNVFEPYARIRKRDLPEALITGVLALKVTWSIETLAASTTRKQAVGGDNVTNLERDSVAGNEVGGLDLFSVAVMLDVGPGRKEPMRALTALSAF